ncbi:unnamed protein product, partial [Allacma fusca]
MFKKSENYSGKWYNDRFHSKKGNLHVTDPIYNEFKDVYCKAMKEMGIPTTDLNGDYIEGCSLVTTSQEANGMRHDTYNAFIFPI